MMYVETGLLGYQGLNLYLVYENLSFGR